MFGLNAVILHNALGVALMCKRVVSLWDSSPVYVLLTFTLLVLCLLLCPLSECLRAWGSHFEQMGGTNTIFLASVRP